MSETKNYKVVTFKTSEASTAAYCALISYQDFAQKNLKEARRECRHGGADYWTERLACINAAIADYDAAVLMGLPK
jgi:hypothetical protein